MMAATATAKQGAMEPKAGVDVGPVCIGADDELTHEEVLGVWRNRGGVAAVLTHAFRERANPSISAGSAELSVVETGKYGESLPEGTWLLSLTSDVWCEGDLCSICLPGDDGEPDQVLRYVFYEDETHVRAVPPDAGWLPGDPGEVGEVVAVAGLIDGFWPYRGLLIPDGAGFHYRAANVYARIGQDVAEARRRGERREAI